MSMEAKSANARLNSYPIMIDSGTSNDTLVARVNFDEKFELLFREIRHLKWLGFERDIPRTVSHMLLTLFFWSICMNIFLH